MNSVKSEPTDLAVLDLSPMKSNKLEVTKVECDVVSEQTCISTPPHHESHLNNNTLLMTQTLSHTSFEEHLHSDSQGHMTDSDEVLHTSSTNTNRFGRSFVNGRPLPESLRVKILSMSKEGVRPCEISRQLQVSHGCVSKILNRFSKTGSITPGRIGGSKPKVTTPDVVYMVHAYKQSRPHVYAWEIRRMLIKDGICTEQSAPSVSSINRIVRNRAPNESSGSSATGNYEEEFSMNGDMEEFDGVTSGRVSRRSGDNVENGQHVRNGDGSFNGSYSQPPAKKLKQQGADPCIPGYGKRPIQPNTARLQKSSSTTISISQTKDDTMPLQDSVVAASNSTNLVIANGSATGGLPSSNKGSLLLQVNGCVPTGSISVPLSTMNGLLTNSDISALLQQHGLSISANNNVITTSPPSSTSTVYHNQPQCFIASSTPTTGAPLLSTTSTHSPHIPNTLQVDLPLVLAQALASASSAPSSTNITTSTPTVLENFHTAQNNVPLLSLVTTGQSLNGSAATGVQLQSTTAASNLANLLAAAASAAAAASSSPAAGHPVSNATESSNIATPQSQSSTNNLILNTSQAAHSINDHYSLLLQQPGATTLGSSLLPLLAATNPLLWSSLLNIEKLSLGDCHFVVDSEQKTHLIRYCGSSKWQMIGSCQSEMITTSSNPSS